MMRHYQVFASIVAVSGLFALVIVHPLWAKEPAESSDLSAEELFKRTPEFNDDDHLLNRKKNGFAVSDGVLTVYEHSKAYTASKLLWKDVMKTTAKKSEYRDGQYVMTEDYLAELMNREYFTKQLVLDSNDEVLLIINYKRTKSFLILTARSPSRGMIASVFATRKSSPNRIRYIALNNVDAPFVETIVAFEEGREYKFDGDGNIVSLSRSRQDRDKWTEGFVNGELQEISPYLARVIRYRYYTSPKLRENLIEAFWREERERGHVTGQES